MAPLVGVTAAVGSPVGRDPLRSYDAGAAAAGYTTVPLGRGRRAEILPLTSGRHPCPCFACTGVSLAHSPCDLGCWKTSKSDSSARRLLLLGFFVWGVSFLYLVSTVLFNPVQTRWVLMSFTWDACVFGVPLIVFRPMLRQIQRYARQLQAGNLDSEQAAVYQRKVLAYPFKVGGRGIPCQYRRLRLGLTAGTLLRRLAVGPRGIDHDLWRRLRAALGDGRLLRPRIRHAAADGAGPGGQSRRVRAGKAGIAAAQDLRVQPHARGGIARVLWGGGVHTRRTHARNRKTAHVCRAAWRSWQTSSGHCRHPQTAGSPRRGGCLAGEFSDQP